MISNNLPSMSPETMNTLQNNMMDKKSEMIGNNEDKKDQLRTAAVQSSYIQHQENMINSYMNSGEDSESNSIDLPASNINYTDVKSKYEEYGQQKMNEFQNKYNDFEEKLKENIVEIQSKGNFVNMTA
jgi:hypothetical protein